MLTVYGRESSPSRAAPTSGVSTGLSIACACRYQDNTNLTASLGKLRRFQMLCKARGQPTLLASVLRTAEGSRWRVGPFVLVTRALVSARRAPASSAWLSIDRLAGASSHAQMCHEILAFACRLVRNAC